MNVQIHGAFCCVGSFKLPLWVVWFQKISFKLRFEIILHYSLADTINNTVKTCAKDHL
jgi:hypothetical protein